MLLAGMRIVEVAPPSYLPIDTSTEISLLAA
jgi:hypothetical protein